MTIEELYALYKQHPSVQTDTRKLKQGDIFFALKGDNFNGNAFAKQAVEAGAAYAIIDEQEYKTTEQTILVDNALNTLQQLAKYHREQFNKRTSPLPVIAITGSNGKTTTKELVHAVLSTMYETYTTEGNLNNHIGIPLTILKIKEDAQMAIIEMGANHLKEIASYCEYAQPTHGIITNCGKAHLEGFGSIEGVRKGKGELYDHLRAHNGTAFVMWDYDYLREISKGISTIIKYGTAEADIAGKLTSSEPFLEVEMTKGVYTGNIKTQLVGDYNLPNVLVAAAVGKFFNVPDAHIKAAIEGYAPSNSRSQLVEKGSTKIILDAYNANPSSMKLAIENFAKLPASKKILMLGGMAELGQESVAEHKAIIDVISQYKWKDVVLVGGDFLLFDHPYITFQNAIEAREWLLEQDIDDAYILIKGSRSMKMEGVLV